MPIRINLLAEAQALEELRRKDPVKRAVLAGAALVALALAYSSSLQFKAIIAKAELNHVESQLATRTNEFQQVLENQKKLAEVNRKLGALQQLATNRLLYGNLLNALQQTTVDDVQLLRMRVDQTYLLSEATKGKTNATSRAVAAKPAKVTEKILLTLDAKDSGANPGDQVNRFKQAVSACPYFQAAMGKTNEVRLASLSPPQVSENKPFVLFTFECRYQEKTR